jgi:hypothetical protein
MPPWERYQQTAPQGPWSRYQTPQAPSPPTAPAPAEAPRSVYQDGQVIGEQLPSTSTAPLRIAVDASPEPSLIDTIMSGADYADNTGANFFEGARRGVSNTLGLPVDAINAVPMLWGGDAISQNPVGGADSIDWLLRGFGLLPDAPEPTDFVQRAAGRIGQELGAASVPAVGLAAQFGGRGLAAGRAAPELAKLFGAEAAAVNPARFLGNEATYATAAGLGASAANEFTGNQNGENAWIDAGGAVAGVGATGIAEAAIRSGTDIARAFFGNGSFQDEVVREAVMRDLAAAGGITAAPGEAPDLTPLIQQASGSRVADAIPGYQESLADRTRNPGIAAMEYSRQSGPNAGTYAQQRANNNAAIDEAFAPLEPQGSPGQFSTALETERTARVGAAAQQTAAARTAFDNATRDLLPALTAEGRGANIRTALQDASDGAKEILSEAWRPLDQAEQSVDMGILRAAFGEAADATPMALQNRLPEAAGVPSRLIDPENPNTIMQPLSEVMGIRTALTDELREAGITPQRRRLVEDHITRLDSYLDEVVPTDLRQQYDTARAATRDYNDRFTRPQTAIAQTLAEREGLPRSPDSSTAGRFVQSDQGRISDFEALMREAGSDDRVTTAVRDQILQDVRQRGLLDNPQALNEYLGQYGTVFGRFPALRQELGNAGALRTALTDAETNQANVIRDLTSEGRSAVANYLRYHDVKAERAMQNIIASNDPPAAIDELLSFVGDAPQAVNGARKVFWDLMQSKSRTGGRTTMDINGNQPWSPTALAQFLENPSNNAVAQRLYRDNPEHLQRIEEIAEALKGVDTRNAAKAPNSSGTAQGMGSQLFTPEALQSRLYAYGSGRISGTFLVTSLVSVLVRRGVRRAQEQGYQRMMDDILTNADTARLMMEANNPAARQALANKAKLWFGNEASSILNEMAGDDEDATTQAIMRTEALN